MQLLQQSIQGQWVCSYPDGFSLIVVVTSNKNASCSCEQYCSDSDQTNRVFMATTLCNGRYFQTKPGHLAFYKQFKHIASIRCLHNTEHYFSPFIHSLYLLIIIRLMDGACPSMLCTNLEKHWTGLDTGLTQSHLYL